MQKFNGKKNNKIHTDTHTQSLSQKHQMPLNSTVSYCCHLLNVLRFSFTSLLFSFMGLCERCIFLLINTDGNELNPRLTSTRTAPSNETKQSLALYEIWNNSHFIQIHTLTWNVRCTFLFCTPYQGIKNGTFRISHSHTQNEMQMILKMKVDLPAICWMRSRAH